MQDQPEIVEMPIFHKPIAEHAETSPNNPPWNSGIAVLVWFGSVLLIVFFPLLFLIPYLLTNGARAMSQEELTSFAIKDPTAVLIQIAAILPVHLVTLLICWLVVTNRNRFQFFKTLGWRSGGMRWWYYPIILIAFFAFAALLGNFLPEQENDLLRILKTSPFVVYAVAAIAVCTAPLVEELVYRGILYSAFQRSFGVPLAVLIVTFLFALVHVPQYYPSYVTIILLTLLSLILTLIRVKTNNLLPCFILHTIFNLVQSIGILANPELSQPGSTPVEQVVMIFFPK